MQCMQTQVKILGDDSWPHKELKYAGFKLKRIAILKNISIIYPMQLKEE